MYCRADFGLLGCLFWLNGYGWVGLAVGFWVDCFRLFVILIMILFVNSVGYCEFFCFVVGFLVCCFVVLICIVV